MPTLKCWELTTSSQDGNTFWRQRTLFDLYSECVYQYWTFLSSVIVQAWVLYKWKKLGDVHVQKLLKRASSLIIIKGISAMDQTWHFHTYIPVKTHYSVCFSWMNLCVWKCHVWSIADIRGSRSITEPHEGFLPYNCVKLAIADLASHTQNLMYSAYTKLVILYLHQY